MILLLACTEMYGQGALTYRWRGEVYVTITRDTSGVLIWKLDTAGVRVFIQARIDSSAKALINDSLDVLLPRVLHTPSTLGKVLKVGPGGVIGWYPDSAGAAPATDSLRRITASPVAYFGHAVWTTDTDTAGIRLFGNDVSGALGAGSAGSYFPYTSGHAVRTFLIDAIEITHSFDTSATLRRRDTVVITNGLDSIPAGSNFWFSYHPTSDATFNGTGAPILRLFYATLNATSGTYHDSYYWKIPQILGVRLSHRGVRADHHIKVTLWVREKIPGSVY